MKTSTRAKFSLGKLQTPLAAASAVAGVVAGVLVNLLTSHWLWGTACGLLAVTAFLAAAAAVQAHQERSSAHAAAAVVNSPTSGMPYTSFIWTGDSYGSGSVNNSTLTAGGKIKLRFKTHYGDRHTNIRIGGFSLIAFMAIAIAVAGTVPMYRNPFTGSLESPAELAAEGGHSSPAAAVKGFLGDTFTNNWTGACGYEPPGEQDCSAGTPRTGNLSVGSAIVEGTRALVPLSGRICEGECANIHTTGLPQGTDFGTAYADAWDPPDSSTFLVPCVEVKNKWYVHALTPGSVFDAGTG